ncbi:glutathione S-transferase N-terminal domain-containing protein [Pelagibius sp. CAU 1746]|uniref:glutathione S-transferase N-terminal domain-containing protein n=1 Tax=Pelagibius sp. CAU 1746 TaxID=3140370 RepID=UPI00325B0528
MSLVLYERLCADDRRPSPFCWRARLALAHKGLTPELRAIGFTESEEVAFSGQAEVPVLIDGDAVVHDSWAIACHLEDAYPEAPSLFDGPGGRALSRLVNHWVDHSLQRALAPILSPYLLASVRPEDRAYYRRSRETQFGMTMEQLAVRRPALLEALHPVLEPLRQRLAETSFLCGERPAYADYLVFGEFQLARSVCDVDLLGADEGALRGWRSCMLDLHGGLARSVTAFETAA